MPFKSKTDNLVIKKMARWERRLFNALFLALYALVLVRLWWPMNLPGQPGWPDAVLLVLAVVSTVATLARHLPLQNILFAALVIVLTGGAVTWLNLNAGIPFGPLTLGDNMGPKLRQTLPWAMPVIWVVAILNSRGVARLILRPRRKSRAYGYWLAGLTAGLMVLFDLAFDPFASRVKHYWVWGPTKFPVVWQGAPLVNFAAWAVVTLLILACVTPLLINKHPTHRRPPDFHPFGVWLGGILLFAVAAALNRLWVAAAADAAIGIVTAVFAIRGARW